MAPTSEPQVPGGVSGVVVVLCDALVAALVALLHRVDLEGGVQRDVVPARKREGNWAGLPSSRISRWDDSGKCGDFEGRIFRSLGLILGKVSKIFEPYVTSS